MIWFNAELTAAATDTSPAAYRRGFIFCVTPDQSKIDYWQDGGAPIEAAGRTATNTGKRRRYFSFLPQNE